MLRSSGIREAGVSSEEEIRPDRGSGTTGTLRWAALALGLLGCSTPSPSTEWTEDPERPRSRRSGTQVQGTQDPPRTGPPTQGPEQEGTTQTQGEAQTQGQTGTQEPGQVPVPNEVIVTAERWEEPTLEVPRSTNVVDQKKIQERLPQTTPDALEEEVGIVVQKTNQGGGSPIIRGRTGKEILMLIDGQRFNDATFRRNTQYLNTIDLDAVERIEVVRGPASVLYGSDAMGGAINLITRRREPTGEDAIGGRLLGQFDSANLGGIAHLGLNAEVDGFGFTGGYTWKWFDDLRAGSHGDPIGAVDIDGVQDPTAYTEQDFSFSMMKRLSEHSTLDFLFMYGSQQDVPRSDVLIANEKQPVPPDLVRNFDPQILRWWELRYTYDDPGETLEGLLVTATFNNPEEGRDRVRTNSPDTTTTERDESYIPGLSVQANLVPGRDHRLTTGIDAYYQTVSSERKVVDMMGTTDFPDGRYPDGSTYQSYGIYVQDQWKMSEDWSWTNGIRYSVNKVDFDLRGLTVGPVGPFDELDETYDDFTFSTALSWKVGQDTYVYGSFSKGFRAPNLDDLAVLGDFASGERVPNLAVQPETVYTPEIGVKHWSSRFRGEADFAVAFYQDLLDNQFAFNDGVNDVFQIDNVGRAIIYTVEGLVSYVTVPSDGFSPEQTVYADASANFGENTTANEPVSKVPPPQWEVGYRIEELEGRWFAETFLLGALEQNNLSAADEADPRFPVNGTPAWWTFNLRGGYTLGEHLRISLALENIFDQRYRVHGSGIDAPGFNTIIQLELTF